jgi:hypothetical protein
MDFEAGTLRCEHCQTDLRPDRIFTNSTVNHLATLIPDEYRDVFLGKLGFERRPVRRTPVVALWLLIGLMAIGAFLGCLLQWGHPLRMILVALGGIAFIYSIWKYYKEEEKPKWKKRKSKRGQICS